MIGLDSEKVHGADYVCRQKVVPNINGYVRYVIKDWENIRRFTRHQKVGTLNAVTFHGYILTLLEKLRL